VNPSSLLRMSIRTSDLANIPSIRVWKTVFREEFGAGMASHGQLAFVRTRMRYTGYPTMMYAHGICFTVDFRKASKEGVQSGRDVHDIQGASHRKLNHSKMGVSTFLNSCGPSESTEGCDDSYRRSSRYQLERNLERQGL
jgi:hypothetical protein